MQKVFLIIACVEYVGLRKMPEIIQEKKVDCMEYKSRNAYLIPVLALKSI